ncbi:unnamed protein product [Paramecium sonneborni]|uniref:RING-type E3 ubiquitin transferase n=1 Tax=Paramecium sonneborni TaxID=65129 RepID=A0A8S1QJV8_9CILI|nr:unnamed protein product [Paramecium sonneborni]
MSKHRHSKDKLYVTYSEHMLERGGKKENKATPLTRLPFDHCSLSLEPFKNPVCTSEGHVFDIVNIVPFIRKYKRNPIDGQPLKNVDLIQLKFHKNDKGEYHDPISFKVFTDHTKLVAIKVSGNVYTSDTIEELNRKPKFWKDLISGEVFNYKDIIVLQDPKNIESRTIKNFDFLKNNLKLDQQTEDDVYVNLNDSGKRIMEMAQEQNVHRQKEQKEREKQTFEEIEQIKKKVKEQMESNQLSVKEFLELSSKSGDFVSERYATEHDSVSVTSTQMTLKTKPLGQVQYRNMNEDEIRKLLYERIRKAGQKGYVQLITNYGNINFELHCDLVPMTCENFLELCEKGYYNQTKFHKLIENELLEGGDPTATGYGGESIFGKPFRIEINNLLSHSKAGIVSMGNLGANHQTSHFFITLAECKKYDGKYAVFGEVVGGYQSLYQINKLPTNMWQRPEVTIRLKEIKVIKNPFRDMMKIMLQEKEVEKEQKLQDKEKERWLDDDGFSLPTKVSTTSQIKGLGLASNLIQQFSTQELQKKQLKQYSFDSWL